MVNALGSLGIGTVVAALITGISNFLIANGLDSRIERLVISFKRSERRAAAGGSEQGDYPLQANAPSAAKHSVGTPVVDILERRGDCVLCDLLQGY